METKTEIKTFKIDCLCDYCKIGYMRPTGEVLNIYPMKFPHNCTNCENKKDYSDTYPLTRQEEIPITSHIPKIVIGELKKDQFCDPQSLFQSQ